jgi:hypothetical protein
VEYEGSSKYAAIEDHFNEPAMVQSHRLAKNKSSSESRLINKGRFGRDKLKCTPATILFWKFLSDVLSLHFRYKIIF